jgi:hypothetical protein
MGYKHLVLVEGKDDLHVLGHLLDHHGIDCEIAKKRTQPNLSTLFIRETGGITKLLESLSIEIDNGDLERLGVILDADTNIEGRWQSLSDKLRESGAVDLPDAPHPEGTIVTVKQTRHEVIVGIWLMPDNTIPGILEDFVQFLVPDDDLLLERAKQAINQIPAEERPFPLIRQSKAEIHTWLAWQKEPGKPLGQAITARYLKPSAAYAQTLIAWILRVFNLVTKND